MPKSDQLLIEKVKTREGHHLFIYPFEGRSIHEGMASVVAHRLSMQFPVTFSIAMNDYGFELLSSDEVRDESLVPELFSDEDIDKDIYTLLNQGETARRQFREIARVTGLIFTGFPGRKKADRHLQASSGLLYDVFARYDPSNLLLAQALREVIQLRFNGTDFHKALERVRNRHWVIRKPKRPTPFAFPILVDRLREQLSSEKLEDRVKRMTLTLEKEARNVG